VCGKGVDISGEYDDLLVSPTWAMILSDSGLGGRDGMWLAHCSVSLTLTHAAGLKSRVVDQCSKFLGQLLKLAFPGLSASSPARAELSQWIFGR
jgi:hypothetical protein